MWTAWSNCQQLMSDFTSETEQDQGEKNGDFDLPPTAQPENQLAAPTQEGSTSCG